MAGKKFTLEAAEAARVELPFGTFEVAEANRSVVRALSENQKRIEKAQDELGEDAQITDEFVRLVVDTMAIAIKPSGQGDEGESFEAGVMRLWLADELPFPWLMSLFQFVMEVVQESVDAGEG
jgi:hypothetical protein